MTYDDWITDPESRLSRYDRAIQSIIDKTGCTLAEAEEQYECARDDYFNRKFDEQRDRELDHEQERLEDEADRSQE